MAYTKILSESTKDLIYEDEYEVTKGRPKYIIAYRFKVYELKLIYPTNQKKKRALWLILGDNRRSEKAFIHFELNNIYNSIEKHKVINSRLDKELLEHLTKSLLIKFYTDNQYYFSGKILQVSSETNN